MRGVGAKWRAGCASLGAVALTLLFAPETSAQDPSVKELMAAAVEAREAGERETVVKLLLEAYAIEAAPQIMNNLGRTYEDMGRYRDALKAYQHVADDQQATGDLRALNAARMAGVLARLGRAWVDPQIQPGGTTVLVDGEPPNAPPGEPFSVSAGTRTLELAPPEGGELVLRFVSFELDRLTPYREDLTESPGADGHLERGSLDPSPAWIEINGYRIRGSGAAWSRIRLQPGSYRLVLSQGNGEPLRVELDLAAGDRVELASVFPGQGQGGRGTGIWPMVTGGGGLVATALGVIFALEANGRIGDMNSDIEAHTAADTGQIVGLDMKQLAEDRDSATSQRTAGFALVGVGLSVAITGGLWWLLASDDPAGAPSSGAFTVHPGPEGLVLQGRF